MSAANQEVVLDKSHYRAIDKEGTFLMRETTYKRKCLILTGKKRAERDAAPREKLLERLREHLGREPITRQFVTNKGYRQYLMGLDKGGPTLIEQAIANPQHRDVFLAWSRA